MRHGMAGKKFQRFSSWRKATVRDIAKATLIHQSIRTTEARAKEARKLVDRVITIAKGGTLWDRRQAFKILCDHQLVKKIFDKIAPLYKNRPGGYTRIIPLGLRRGDNAQVVILELTEKQVVVAKPKKSAKSKTKEAAPASEISKSTPVAKEEIPEKKASAPVKAPTKKDVAQPDKSKQPGKGLTGGLQKMFRRKVGE